MPLPLTYQTNSMPLHEGLAVGLNSNGQASNFAWTKRYVTKAASYTILRTESGTCFVTTGATATVTFTLPAISTGPWHYEVIVGADQTVAIAAETADTMVTFNDLAADSLAFSTASEKIGGRFLIDCDGTTLFVNALGVSHRQTATVTT